MFVDWSRLPINVAGQCIANAIISGRSFLGRRRFGQPDVTRFVVEYVQIVFTLVDADEFADGTGEHYALGLVRMGFEDVALC